ncbi:hypothetical protein P4637_03160 [Halalkalibacterium halodurans]|uniref:hypothetical protein n=1 Tax=Halalkalibacterium halodurans TaxID=86665 RepID=UPI002E216824|nr:hypothetical protein [Halalkalibacterium halodurans]MED4105499.1 hypothetical protein [Halalkalibacterium halodurans]MED4109295.1 hypothetical protein [Halalkalibacterium halodurans]MED4149691.1 hypothetical protein [Halalkalibacterium halodurans]
MDKEKEMSERMTRLETKIDMMISLLEKVDKLQFNQQETYHKAKDAYEHATRAHERLDKKDRDEHKFKWLIYAALVTAVLGLILNGGSY